MANGILALPLMFVYALVIRLSKPRILTLFLLSTITITLYFYDYTSPGGHGSLKDALLNNPFGLFQYLLLYLGGPFYHMTLSLIVAQLAGLFLIGSSAYFSLGILKKPSKPLQLALLFFILYIGGTALGTGGGRLIFGIEQALSSRYQTPAVMAWASLLILYSPRIVEKIESKPLLTIRLLFLIPALLLPQQLIALTSKHASLFEKEIAALALEFRIKDQAQISLVFPTAEGALLASKTAVEKNLSIFGHPNIKDASLLIGEKAINTTTQCIGNLDQSAPIPNVSDYVKVRGWLYQPDDKSVPKIIYITKNNTIIGYALTGQPRDDVAIAIDSKARLSGFKGYVLADKLEGEIMLQGLDSECALNVASAPSPFVTHNAEIEN